jgi:hypothetical protein
MTNLDDVKRTMADVTETIVETADAMDWMSGMFADTTLADNPQAVITKAIDDLHGVASDLIGRINAAFMTNRLAPLAKMPPKR